MPKKRDIATLAQVLGGGGLPWRVASRLPGAGLREAWRRTAGDELAERARPVCLLEDGTLVVAVKGGVWRQEMELLAPELLARLQGRGQPVAGLRLVKARSEAEPPPPPPPPQPLTSEQEEAIARAVAAVRDPELRQSLTNLLRAQALAQQSSTLDHRE